jgi:arginyl-tRNA synthetase
VFSRADRREHATSAGVIDDAVSAALARVGVPVPPRRIVSKARRLREADAVVDTREFDAADGRDKLGAAIEEAVTAVDFVAGARFAEPFVALRFDAAALRALVCDDVLARGAGYGAADTGRGACLHVQFSSPNLNKALHVGHLRNNFLGMAVSRLVANQGYEVLRFEAPSNHGQHISKAVVGYLLWSTTPDPVAAGMKPDHFVQSFYVRFNEHRATLADDSPEARGLDELVATVTSRLYTYDESLVPVWRALTEWTYDGIKETYRRIGTRFDTAFREDESLHMAAAAVEARLGTACFRRPDGSVYVDLTDRGLRRATLLRGDNTPVLCAQYLGINLRRQAVFPEFGLLNIMGREYMDRVPELVGTLERLGAERVTRRHEVVFHAHVTLPEGRMRSRDGSSITADSVLDATHDRFVDLLTRRSAGAASAESISELAHDVSVAFLKYHFLRRPVDRDVVWDERSLWRETLPRFQRLFDAYTKAETQGWRRTGGDEACSGHDCIDLLLHVEMFPDVARRAAEEREPALLVRLLDDLAEAATASACTAHRRAWQAASVTFRRACHLLNLRLPRGFELLGPSR